MVLLMVGVFSGETTPTALRHRLASRCWSLVVALAARASAGAARHASFDGAFIVDAFARFVKVLMLLGSAPRC